MLQLVIDRAPVVAFNLQDDADYGVWTGYRMPENRSDWHPLVRGFYDYCLSVTPPGHLLGRQHILPEDIAFAWPRLWMLDVFHRPLRYRYRLCGTEVVRSLGREVTGCWLDEVHPPLIANPLSRDRFRMMAETGRPTWRHGPPLWPRNPDHRTVETCIVPLAADGRTVDKMIAASIIFDPAGKPI